MSAWDDDAGMAGDAMAEAMSESIVTPNAAYHLCAACPTGKHTGTVHARIAGGMMTLDCPPIYVCGCLDPREAPCA